MATRQHKPVPVENSKVYSQGLRGRVEFNCVIQPCTSRLYSVLIVSASYDEYTALVKSDGASKHVSGNSQGCVLLVETSITVTY